MSKAKLVRPSDAQGRNPLPDPSTPSDVTRVPVETVPEPAGALPTKADLEAAGIRIALCVLWERHGWATASAAYFGSQILSQGWPLVDDILYMRTELHRNRSALNLLASDYTHLLMLDADHLHPADTVYRHARWVLDDPARLVVGGLHFRRGAPYWPCAFMAGADGHDHPLVEWPRGLLPLRSIGHGTLLVSRDVFARIQYPWWRYEYFQDPAAPDVSDDMPFSRACNAAGITLWCDTTATSPHLIDHAIDERDFRAHLARYGMTPTSSSAIHTLDDQGVVTQQITADEFDDAELVEIEAGT